MAIITRCARAGHAFRGRDGWQPEGYDLVFNADRPGVEEMVDHVVLAPSRAPAQNAVAENS